MNLSLIFLLGLAAHPTLQQDGGEFDLFGAPLSGNVYLPDQSSDAVSNFHNTHASQTSVTGLDLFSVQTPQPITPVADVVGIGRFDGPAFDPPAAGLGVLSPTLLAMKSFGLPTVGHGIPAIGLPLVFLHGRKPKDSHEKRKARKLTCATNMITKKHYKKRLTFLAATIKERNETKTGHKYVPLGYSPPYHPGGRFLFLNLEVHSYGTEGVAEVVFTSWAFISHYGCEADNLGEVLTGNTGNKKNDGVIAKLSLGKKTTAAAQTDQLPFQDLDHLAGRGLVVVLPDETSGYVTSRVTGDILACCVLGFDDQLRTLADSGFGLTPLPKQPYSAPHLQPVLPFPPQVPHHPPRSPSLPVTGHGRSYHRSPLPRQFTVSRYSDHKRLARLPSLRQTSSSHSASKQIPRLSSRRQPY